MTSQELTGQVEQVEAAPSDSGRTKRPRKVRVELGRCWLPARRALDLDAGSVIELDAPVSDDVVVHVEGRPFADAEPVVIDGRFCVRIRQIASRARMNRNE